MPIPSITLEGRAVADPELKFTAGGKAVASLRVAASESRKNADGSWEDGDRLFVGVSVWEQAGEVVAEHVRKGDRVVVTGKLFEREYEKKDGTKGRSLEVKYATVAKILTAPTAARVTAPAASTPDAFDPWGSSDQPPF